MWPLLIVLVSILSDLVGGGCPGKPSLPPRGFVALRTLPLPTGAEQSLRAEPVLYPGERSESQAFPLPRDRFQLMCLVILLVTILQENCNKRGIMYKCVSSILFLITAKKNPM